LIHGRFLETGNDFPGNERIARLRRFLKPENGIPSHDALSRLLCTNIAMSFVWSSRGESVMKPSVALASHREAIHRVVASHRARNPRVFGSVIRSGDTEGSDLDILIDPTPETTLLDIGAIRHEPLQLLGVPVDVLTPKALPAKFRESVLAEAMPV
jgi:predicted nucleotidyltransferase